MWTTSLVLARRARGIFDLSGIESTGSRCHRSAHAGGALCKATMRKVSPSERNKLPKLASQSRTAFANIAWNTGCSSPGELLMIRSTSDVAVCCSSASGQFARTRPHLVEQSHVLNGDRRLIGEGGDQLDLLCPKPRSTTLRCGTITPIGMPLPQ